MGVQEENASLAFMESQTSAQEWMNRGVYTAPEAARLVNLAVGTSSGPNGKRVESRHLRRWLLGYHHSGGSGFSEPLWKPEIATNKKTLLLSFRDLLELMFVAAFRRRGVSMQTIRRLITKAVALVNDPYPLSSPGFRTDGKRILADALDLREHRLVFDLDSGQQLLDIVFERLARGIEYEDLTRVRWWPLGEDRQVLLDPRRRFGRPIVPEGVPTATLADAYAAEGSAETVASWYEVSERSVEDAVEYEEQLKAA